MALTFCFSLLLTCLSIPFSATDVNELRRVSLLNLLKLSYSRRYDILLTCEQWQAVAGLVEEDKASEEIRKQLVEGIFAGIKSLHLNVRYLALLTVLATDGAEKDVRDLVRPIYLVFFSPNQIR